jgi:hypothetical protein
MTAFYTVRFQLSFKPKKFKEISSLSVITLIFGSVFKCVNFFRTQRGRSIHYIKLTIKHVPRLHNDWHNNVNARSTENT